MAINPNELRLGNFVIRQLYSPDRIDYKHKVEINDFYWFDESGRYDEYWDSFNPIPITKEWLLKFGFVERAMSFEIDIDSFGRGKRLCFSGDYLYLIDSERQNTIPTDVITIWNKDLMKEFYIHQLQNLYFSITKTELVLQERGEKV